MIRDTILITGMRNSKDIPLVQTIRERCRVCYTCVRECPAKAIRIADGQAEVQPERCIACGNCVRVCSQLAKTVKSDIPEVKKLLSGKAKTVACLAPSFPVEFGESYRQIVGAIRKLGFAMVNEVAFGADLVAERYKQLLEKSKDRRYIAATCPAIVSYIERLHPDLAGNIAPIVSPMIAEARALRHLHGKNLKIVFIGPCIAKKGECSSESVKNEIDAVLTFVELRELFDEFKISIEASEPSEFDPPHANSGALFPLSRGLLQAAEINEDLLAGNVIAADGRTNFVEAIKEFESGDLDVRLLEVLACQGCIMGAGTSCKSPLFSRRSRIRQYVSGRLASINIPRWQHYMDKLKDLDLSRGYQADDMRIPVPFSEEIEQIMTKMGKLKTVDELNCGACGYDTCREHAIAIFKGLAECEMCLPHTIEQLRRTVKDLATSNEELASTQEALMQSEKLASMGQLAAGIAHEVNNPLGIVLMYAHLLLDAVDKKASMRDDLKIIAEQADRCRRIVAGLLHFARQNKVIHQEVNVPELVDRTLRAIHPPETIKTSVTHAMANPTAELDPDQITQVLTNLITNAIAAMPEGGNLTIHTCQAGETDETVRISVEDTGHGITPENMSRLFTPFFTTKQIGKGTGLGLAVSYGIVKMHRGNIQVKSNSDPAAGRTGSVFTMDLPRLGPKESSGIGTMSE